MKHNIRKRLPKQAQDRTEPTVARCSHCMRPLQSTELVCCTESTDIADIQGWVGLDR